MDQTDGEAGRVDYATRLLGGGMHGFRFSVTVPLIAGNVVNRKDA